MTLPHERRFASVGVALYRPPTVIPRRTFFHFICFLLLSWFLLTPPKTFLAGQKTDKFKGYVVTAGPKAITVKNKNNIYQVRTFNYSPKVEQQLMKKKVQPGTLVTVHYTRGTDTAVKLK